MGSKRISFGPAEQLKQIDLLIGGGAAENGNASFFQAFDG
jgi:hypothetical protein